MVGIFSRFSGYMSTKPQHYPSLLPLDKKLVRVISEEEEEEGGEGGTDGRLEGEGGDDDDDEEEEVEVDGEFKPIKHPLEPPDDDQPAKYPSPFSSLDEGELKESFAESLKKIAAETSIGIEGRVADQTPTQSDRKRYRDPSIPSPNYNIFQVFQQCKFEA